MRVLLAFATFSKLSKVTKTTENIIKLTNTKDKYDIQEQRERIKSLKLDNKERTENNKITDAPINIIDEWAGELEGRQMTFNIQKNVNPHFKPVWISRLPYNVLKRRA